MRPGLEHDLSIRPAVRLRLSRFRVVIHFVLFWFRFYFPLFYYVYCDVVVFCACYISGFLFVFFSFRERCVKGGRGLSEGGAGVDFSFLPFAN